MGVHTLYRPVGIEEYRLIARSEFRVFPPRLDWQPIFYPVLNFAYAEQIARDWNARDSGIGIVTAFDVETDYLEKFESRQVGDRGHQELWVPAEQLSEFNQRIRGLIRVVATYYSDDYTGERIPLGECE